MSNIGNIIYDVITLPFLIILKLLELLLNIFSFIIMCLYRPILLIIQEIKKK